MFPALVKLVSIYYWGLFWIESHETTHVKFPLGYTALKKTLTIHVVNAQGTPLKKCIPKYCMALMVHIFWKPVISTKTYKKIIIWCPAFSQDNSAGSTAVALYLHGYAVGEDILIG